MQPGSESFDRIPIILQFPESPKFTETYGFAGTQGFVALEGQRFIPRAQPTSDTVYLFMHPSSTLQLLPMPSALANAGLHVICAGSRYPKNDSALIMEKVCFDLGQYVKWATGPQYLAEAGDALPGGWAAVPPGTRQSLYENPKYQEAAAAFADITLQAKELGIAPPDVVAATLQERAWTSRPWTVPASSCSPHFTSHRR